MRSSRLGYHTTSRSMSSRRGSGQALRSRHGEAQQDRMLALHGGVRDREHPEVGVSNHRRAARQPVDCSFQQGLFAHRFVAAWGRFPAASPIRYATGEPPAHASRASATSHVGSIPADRFHTIPAYAQRASTSHPEGTRLPNLPTVHPFGPRAVGRCGRSFVARSKAAKPAVPD